MPTVNEDLNQEKFNLHLWGHLITDGTTTRVELSGSDFRFPKVTGVSRRRKGDPRNSETGRRIAVARALRALADEYEKGLFS